MSRPKGSPNKTPRKGKTSNSGRPSISIRFDPEELAAIQGRGGAPWARRVILDALFALERAAIVCENCGASGHTSCG